MAHSLTHTLHGHPSGHPCPPHAAPGRLAGSIRYPFSCMQNALTGQHRGHGASRRLVMGSHPDEHTPDTSQDPQEPPLRAPQPTAPVAGAGFVLLSAPIPSEISNQEHGSSPAQVPDQMASELDALREQHEEDLASRLLPAFASSVAYDNLARWQRETGMPSGSLAVPGLPDMPLEQLYRITEKQERDLREGVSSWAGAGGFRGLAGKTKPSSSLDGFASRPGNDAYAGLAASMMARVRSRFLGYDDDEGAVAHVLDTLLWSASDFGERAELLHTACNPPGLPYQPPPGAQPTQGSNPAASQPSHQRVAGGSARLSSSAGSDMLGGAGRMGGVAWQPDGSHLGAYSRYTKLNSGVTAGVGQPQGPEQGASSNEGVGGEQQQAGEELNAGHPTPGKLLVTTPQALLGEIDKRLEQLAGGADSGPVLPCGSDMQQALNELSEVVQEYEVTVWSRRTAMEL